MRDLLVRRAASMRHRSSGLLPARRRYNPSAQEIRDHPIGPVEVVGEEREHGGIPEPDV
jgi:hypothetical protein